MAGSERMTWFALFQAHQPLYVSDMIYCCYFLQLYGVWCVVAYIYV